MEDKATVLMVVLQRLSKLIIWDLLSLVIGKKLRLVNLTQELARKINAKSQKVSQQEWKLTRL